MRRSLRSEVGTVKRSVLSLLAEVRANLRDGRRLQGFMKGKTGLALNIGCGKRVKSGWVNLDINPVSNEVYYFDARNPLPLAAGSVRRINCEHFLGHLGFDEALGFLSECYRVLEPAGSLRIIVPDAEKYFRAYVDNDAEYFKKLQHLGGAVNPLETRNEVVNQSFRLGGEYHSAWDFETLELYCCRVGFSGMQRSSWKEGPAEYQIDGEDWWRPFESLYCEIQR